MESSSYKWPYMQYRSNWKVTVTSGHSTGGGVVALGHRQKGEPYYTTGKVTLMLNCYSDLAMQVE